METKQQTRSYQEGLVDVRAYLKEVLPAEALNTFDVDADQLAAKHVDILKKSVGDKVTDFALPNASGDTVSLSQLLGKGKVVLVFYRGVWCPYCNLQLSQYQQQLEEMKALGAHLVAISPQNADSSLSIQEKNELQFDVLSDQGNQVARQFTTVFKNGDAPVQAMAGLGFEFDAFYDDNSRELPIPAVFVIDEEQRVLFAQAEGGDYRKRVEASAIIEVLKSAQS